jgi:hypothetical protein
MKKSILGLIVVVFIGLTLGACDGQNLVQSSELESTNTPKPSATDTLEPTRTKGPTPTYTITPADTFLPPTSTSTPFPTPMQTGTPFPTLGATQSIEAILESLYKPESCSVPCFWGIIPGETTIREARNLLSYLRLSLKFIVADDGIRYYEANCKLETGLSILLGLAEKNDVIQNLRVSISPKNDNEMQTQREWKAYSPETMINQYGPPSEVHFFLSQTPAEDMGPKPWYVIVMYFDAVDLIVEYGGGQIGSVDYFEACPLVDRFFGIDIWLGKDPVYPPGKAASLEDATDLTMDEFVDLMNSDPKTACFELNTELFP